MTIDLKPERTYQRKLAREFFRSKGRLPENELEFIDWLVEFDEGMGNALGMILDNVENHLLLCQGVLELPKGRVS